MRERWRAASTCVTHHSRLSLWVLGSLSHELRLRALVGGYHTEVRRSLRATPIVAYGVSLYLLAPVPSRVRDRTRSEQGVAAFVKPKGNLLVH